MALFASSKNSSSNRVHGSKATFNTSNLYPAKKEISRDCSVACAVAGFGGWIGTALDITGITSAAATIKTVSNDIGDLVTSGIENVFTDKGDPNFQTNSDFMVKEDGPLQTLFKDYKEDYKSKEKKGFFTTKSGLKRHTTNKSRSGEIRYNKTDYKKQKLEIIIQNLANEIKQNTKHPMRKMNISQKKSVVKHAFGYIFQGIKNDSNKNMLKDLLDKHLNFGSHD